MDQKILPLLVTKYLLLINNAISLCNIQKQSLYYSLPKVPGVAREIKKFEKKYF